MEVCRVQVGFADQVHVFVYVFSCMEVNLLLGEYVIFVSARGQQIQGSLKV